MSASIETRLRSLLEPYDDVVAAYLFGTFGRGEARPDSDVDLAVLFRQPPLGTLDDAAQRLRRTLERALEREVDLISLGTAPPDLIHRVLRDGVLVSEHDRSRRIAFEVRARNEYFDLLPFLHRYRRAGAA